MVKAETTVKVAGEAKGKENHRLNASRRREQLRGGVTVRLLTKG